MSSKIGQGIAVVIPTHNSAETIEETLVSVFSQTRVPDEIIVVDDASTDNTVSLLAAYADRLTVIRRSGPSGSADIPRYEGVQAAQAAYCALLDSDDTWLPEKLAQQEAYMNAHPLCALSHHYVERVDSEGRSLGIRHERAMPDTDRIGIGAELLNHCFICTSAVMVKRDAWISAIDPDSLSGYGTELDFFLAIAAKHEVGFIPEVLGSYRVWASGISRVDWHRAPRDLSAMQRVYQKGLWNPFVTKAGMHRIMAQAACENAAYWRGQRHTCRSLWAIGQALRAQPLSVNAWCESARTLGRRMWPSAKS